MSYTQYVKSYHVKFFHKSKNKLWISQFSIISLKKKINTQLIEPNFIPFSS